VIKANNNKNRQFLLFLFRSVNWFSLPLCFFSFLLTIVFCFAEANFSPFLWLLGFCLIGLLICLVFFERLTGSAIKVFATVLFFNSLFTLLMFFNTTAYYGKPFIGESDAFRHEKYAQQALEAGLGYKETFLYHTVEHSHKSFYYTGSIAVLYKINSFFGLAKHTLIPRFFNSFCISLLGLLVLKLAPKLGIQWKVAVVCAIFCGCWPLTVYNSAVIRRDALFILQSVLFFYCIFNITSGDWKIRYISGAIVGLCSINYLRPMFVFLFLGILGIVWISRIYLIKGKNHVYLSRIILFFASVISICGIIYFFVDLSVFQRDLNSFLDQFERYTERRGEESQGLGSGIFRLPLIFSIPMRIAYGFIYPPPIPSPFILDNFRWFGTLFWIFCLPFLFWSINRAFCEGRNQYSFFLQATSICFVSIFLIVNITTVTEGHQMTYIPFGLILIFYGIENSSFSIKKHLPLMLSAGILSIISYILLKA
jgi:hypothetical protein